jgi:ActD protein
VLRKPPIYGLMAEFESPSAIVAATRRVTEAGYRKVEGYTPFPIEELAEALGIRRTRVPLIVLLGGIFGCLGGFFLQYYIAVIHYPINIGGRPLNSWPSFIVITFELTILAAALAAVLGMLALNGLPMPHHPVFNVPRFAFASRDRFFLVIEATDPKFDLTETKDFLKSLEAREVSDVDY